MNSNKNTLVLISILLLAVAVAYPLSKKGTVVSPESDMTEVQNASDLLVRVQSVSLDLSVITGKHFSSLEDITLPRLNLPKGKKNPFAL